MRLKDKKIIVTAAAQGIGRATAIAFAKEGSNVIATDINLEKLSELSKINDKIKTQILDSTNKEAVENFANSIEDIDVLFHAVGFVHHGTIMDCSSEEFFNSVNVNVYSAYLMTHFFLPKMLKKKKGNIIIITSAASNVKGAPNRFIYGTTKAALNGFVKALAFELAPKGIRINLVSPGMVDTPLIADLPEKVRLLSAAQTPLRALATAEDVAGAISFLASDKSNYLTGETIRVNGGQFML